MKKMHALMRTYWKALVTFVTEVLTNINDADTAWHEGKKITRRHL